MSDNKQNATQINDKLLTAAELEVCQKIATLDTELAGRRAAILVAINEESTQAQASEQTGLTVGQIRYLLTMFRRKRLAIFPDDVLSKVQSLAEPKEEAQTEAQFAVGVEEEKRTKKLEGTLKEGGDSNEASSDEVTKIKKEVKQSPAEAKEEEKPKKSKKAKRDKAVKVEKAKIKAKEKEKGKKSKMTKKDKTKKEKKDKKSKKGKAKKADKKKSKK